MNPEPDKLDQILARAAATEPVEPELLERIAGAVLPGLRPVRPMPSAWVIVAGLLLLSVAVGTAAAAILGMYGIAKLSDAEAMLIFAAIALFGMLAASQSAAEMVPGSKRMANPLALMAGASLALMGLFATLFSGYAMDDFVHQGVPCLRAGLSIALPAGGGAWLILRRGFAVNATAAGLAAGTLAGLAGVTMLELHCANLRAIHVMAWHVAVVPLSAAGGALVARAVTPWERSAKRLS